ncbi:MAG: EAL domain-containing protein [Methylomonas sp.]|nr:EAL domain-containing protein [Methylomonas sp.]
MLSRLGPTAHHIEHTVEKFYASLMNIPAAAVVLDNLTSQEFQQLHERQSHYLSSILSPELSVKRHRMMATEAGRRHVYVGVSAEVLAESSALYGDIVAALLLGRSDTERLKEIITRRFQYDLITQIQAYAWMQKKRLDTYQHIGRREHTANPLDFLQDALETLLGSFDDDVLGIAFGCMRNGNFRYLLAKGCVPYEADDQSFPVYPTVEIPEIEQVWFDEQPLLINNLNLDTRLSKTLRSQCMALGVRSFGVLLAHDLQGAPKGCLLVFSRFPGHFLDNGTLHYWQQVADLTGTNLDFMERSRDRRQHRLSDELRFRQLLAQEKVEMHYQPIVDPSNGRTVKVEALARLKDGDRIISPGLFLSAFGANQLRELFDIGLARVIDDLAGHYPLCSINVPPEVMADTPWLKGLPDHLARLGVGPEQISLEILESALSDDKEIQSALYTIKEAGYSILLDDVGAGESSLLRLATLR